MTAIERVLRAVEEVRRQVNVRIGRFPITGADGNAIGVHLPTSNGAEGQVLVRLLDSIHDAATSCPRCSYVGDGDCACPAVRR